MKRVVFYGNCQALALHKIYSAHVAPRLAASSCFVDSFQKLSESGRSELARADFLVAQVITPKSLAALDALPSSAPRLMFPALAGLFLWPFGSQAHPLNPAVAGPYPAELGDSYLNRKIKQGADVEATVAEYVELDVDRLRNLDRLLEVALEQQRLRDDLCGFSFAPFVAGNFRSKRLFLSPGHPALELTRMWSLEILRQFVPDSDVLDRVERNLTSNPFPNFELPIHPAVVRHFGLTFLPADATYRYGHEGRLTFGEFARRYMRYEWNRELENGFGLIRSGHREAAREKLLAALQISPGSARAHAELGWLLAEAGELEQALGHAREAVRIDPADAHAQARLAHVLSKAGQPDAADAALRHAIELDAGDPALHATLSRGLAQRQRHAEALEAARRAADLKPQDAAVRGHLASLLLRLHRPEEAEGEVRGALLLAPDHPGLLGHLSHALAHQKKDAEALEVARRVIDLTPNDAANRSHVAFLLLRQNRFDEAETELRAAIALTPGRANLHGMLARALDRQGRVEEAVAAARRAVELDDGNSHSHGLLGQLLERAGRPDEAAAATERAVALAPDDPVWQRRLAGLRRPQAESAPAIDGAASDAMRQPSDPQPAAEPATPDLSLHEAVASQPVEPAQSGEAQSGEARSGDARNGAEWSGQTHPAASPVPAPALRSRPDEPSRSVWTGMAGLLRRFRNPGSSISGDQSR
jgi:Flp pilus assembly protein TadD